MMHCAALLPLQWPAECAVRMVFVYVDGFQVGCLRLSGCQCMLMVFRLADTDSVAAEGRGLEAVASRPGTFWLLLSVMGLEPPVYVCVPLLHHSFRSLMCPCSSCCAMAWAGVLAVWSAHTVCCIVVCAAQF